MSTLTISGDGKWILIQEIDEETAEKYAEFRKWISLLHKFYGNI